MVKQIPPLGLKFKVKDNVNKQVDLLVRCLTFSSLLCVIFKYISADTKWQIQKQMAINIVLSSFYGYIISFCSESHVFSS